jgi:hypothetical protein
MVDTVEKVAADKLWNMNTQQSNQGEWILNQHCALPPDLKSILRARMSKIVFRQHRPIAVISPVEIPQRSSAEVCYPIDRRRRPRQPRSDLLACREVIR